MGKESVYCLDLLRPICVLTATIWKLQGEVLMSLEVPVEAEDFWRWTHFLTSTYSIGVQLAGIGHLATCNILLNCKAML